MKPHTPYWQRALCALVLSASLHAILLYQLNATPSQHHPTTTDKPIPLKLTLFAPKAMHPPTTTALNAVDSSAMPLDKVDNATPPSDKLVPSPSVAPNPQTLQQTAHAWVDDGYFSSSEVDRKALPMGDFDTTSLTTHDTQAHFPMRLRIFIDQYGEIVHIETLSVLPQDLALAEKLEELLKNTRFIAAKKNGLDVKSYQDIEFSFPRPIETQQIETYSIELRNK